MAGAALFHIVGVLIQKWSGFFSVATTTGFPLGHLPQVICIGRAMRIMAISAVHSSFLDRVAAGQGELGGIGNMATQTQGGNSPGLNNQIGTGVDGMAVGTGNIIGSMGATIPVMEVEGGVGGVTLETDQRLGSGGQGFIVEQVLAMGLDDGDLVTCHFNFKANDRRHQFTGRTMTGLAVDNHHSRG